MLSNQIKTNDEQSCCRVCHQKTTNRIRCGVLACEACKKFFQRNKDHASTLRCVTGTSDCTLSSGKAALTVSGAVWRLVCPRCRIDKCFKIGMRTLGRRRRRNSPLKAFSHHQSADNNQLVNETRPRENETKTFSTCDSPSSPPAPMGETPILSQIPQPQIPIPPDYSALFLSAVTEVLLRTGQIPNLLQVQ